MCRAGADRNAGAHTAPSDFQAPNQPVPVTNTCGEFKALLKAGDKRTVGRAVLWLDGYYSRAFRAQRVAHWLAADSGPRDREVCAISVNERRTVVDVIGQLHRAYGGRN